MDYITALAPVVAFVLTYVVRQYLDPRLKEEQRAVVYPLIAVCLVLVADLIGLTEHSNLVELTMLALAPTGLHQILRNVFKVSV